MWNFSMHYESNGEERIYRCALKNADIHVILMSGAKFATIEDEHSNQVYIFTVLGNVWICENNPMLIPRSVTLMQSDGNTSKVITMPCKDDVGIFIETPDHIFMMLDIIQKNESKGAKTIQGKLKKYCAVNHVHNYNRDYVMN